MARKGRGSRTGMALRWLWPGLEENQLLVGDGATAFYHAVLKLKRINRDVTRNFREHAISDHLNESHTPSCHLMVFQAGW